MTITINKNFRITSNELSWDVERRAKNTWKKLTYHNTLEAALRSLYRLGVRSIPSSDHQEIIQKMDEWETTIQKAVQRFDEIELQKAI